MLGYIFSSKEFHQLMFFLRKSFGICDSEADKIKKPAAHEDPTWERPWGVALYF